MKILNFALIFSTAAGLDLGLTWKAKSNILLQKPSVDIPEGIYTIQCDDPWKKKFHIGSKNNMLHTLALTSPFILFGSWLYAIPFYYVFEHGLLELTPDPKRAVEFIVQHAKDTEETNAINLLAADGNQDHVGKHVSGNRLKRRGDASLFVAKAGPSYTTEKMNVYLRLIKNRSSRWLRVGRGRVLSRRRKLRLAHHKFSQWTMHFKEPLYNRRERLLDLII